MQFNRSRPIPRCFRWCYKVLSARLSIRWVSLRHTEQMENVVRTGFPDVSMSLLIMKCFRYFISVNGLSVQRGTGGGGGVRLLWKEGREALSILLSVRLVRCAPLKGYIGWSELEVGRGGWGWGALLSTINFSVFQGAIGAMVDQFIILVDVPDGWMGKRRIKCHFLLSSDP